MTNHDRPRITRTYLATLIDFPIILLLPNNEVPGNWITQQCYVIGCKNRITYWSKTGKMRHDRIDAKCEVHRT